MNGNSFIPSTGVERRFAWLSAIPHGSGNEKALSDAILALAKGAGLEAHQDALGNLLVRKPGTPGREGLAPVILQAHLDMVCTKVPGSDHDFARDPIALLSEDGWLRAGGTTLGADDGYGVAYMLELLFGQDAVHPPLECLFTVQEEIGLIGAAHFDTSLIRARRMISMDSGGENRCTVSSCGGCRITLTLPLRPAKVEGAAMKLSVSGLVGGHSAGEIHRGRANALKVLGHLLIALGRAGAGLVEAGGGEASNAIPRDAFARLIVPEDRMEEVRAAFESVRARMLKLFRATDPDMALTLEPDELCLGPVYDLTGASLLAALPDGVGRMDPERPGIVALSDNVGVLTQAEGAWKVQCMIRSASAEHRDLLKEQILAVGEAFGTTAHVDSDYPGMEYNPHSKMRALFAQVLSDMLGRELVEFSMHGGLEIGYFSRSVLGLDITTLGPIAEGGHSPSERMNLASFNRMYDVLRELLARLN